MFYIELHFQRIRMRKFRELISIYINSSIHVALAVVALTYVSAIELALELPDYLVYFIFFASITGYNFVKYAGIAKLYHISLTSNLRLIQIFSFISFLLMLYFGWQLSALAWLVLLPLGLLNFFYAVPVFLKARNLRSIPFLKVFVIALVWAGVSVYLPVIETYTELTSTTHWYAGQRFLMVCCLMIPFEIRDIRFDQKWIKTLPQVLGITKTKILGGLLLLIGSGINFILLDSTHFSVYLLVALSLLLLILFSKVHQKKHFASFWVEALPIFYLFVLIIFN